jgi:hypothetical protein
MPEASPAAAVTPTPSSHPNAPNGTPPPATGAATQTKPPEAESDIAAKYKALETEHQKKVREQIVERRKWEADRKATGEKLTKLEQLEKREANARLNPTAFLKDLYGENWHEVVTEAKVNGVAPAALVQQEIQALRDELAAKDKAREDEGSKAQVAQQEQAQQQARQTIFAESAAWYREKGSEYPLLAKLGAEPAIARIMSQRIEAEFHKTGKVLKTSEVADLIEGEVLEWAQEAGKHEKYKPKLQPGSTSTTVASSKQQQGTQQPAAARRSISNNITGSTSPAIPLKESAKEKRARIEAAYEAARPKR